MSKDGRARIWTWVGYPESLPSDFRNTLNEEHIKWVLSPLHQYDTDENEEKKKAHYHFVAIFESSHSFSQVEEITKKIHATIPQKVNSVRGAIRYLIHLDDQDKFQYSRDEIEVYGGADISEYFKPTVCEKREMLKEMVRYIADNNITEFIDFSLWCAENNEDWFSVLSEQNSYFIAQAIKSQRFKSLNEKK